MKTVYDVVGTPVLASGPEVRHGDQVIERRKEAPQELVDSHRLESSVARCLAGCGADESPAELSRGFRRVKFDEQRGRGQVSNQVMSTGWSIARAPATRTAHRAARGLRDGFLSHMHDAVNGMESKYAHTPARPVTRGLPGAAAASGTRCPGGPVPANRSISMPSL